MADPAARARVIELAAENSRLSTATQKVESQVQATIAANAPLVRQAERAASTEQRWAVVYGGDTTLAQARYEAVDMARRYALPDTAIYLRQGSYRSVALAASRDEADALLAKARQRRSDAYVVNLAKWCPQPQQREGYRECGSP